MALSKRVRLIIAIAVGVLKLAYGDICRAAEAEERPGIFSGLPGFSNGAGQGPSNRSDCFPRPLCHG